VSNEQQDIQFQIAELRSLMVEVRDAVASPKENRAAYSVEEAAAMLGKGAYTVREWCRHGRINATKRAERRGGAELWSVSASEIARYRNEGLLPFATVRNAG
jgi:transposase